MKIFTVLFPDRRRAGRTGTRFFGFISVLDNVDRLAGVLENLAGSWDQPGQTCGQYVPFCSCVKILLAGSPGLVFVMQTVSLRALMPFIAN